MFLLIIIIDVIWRSLAIHFLIEHTHKLTVLPSFWTSEIVLQQWTRVPPGPHPTLHERPLNSAASFNIHCLPYINEFSNSGIDLWTRDPTIFLGRSSGFIPLAKGMCAATGGGWYVGLLGLIGSGVRILLWNRLPKIYQSTIYNIKQV